MRIVYLTKMRTLLCLLTFLFAWSQALAQVPKNNLLADAAIQIGQKGLGTGSAPATSPTKFKPTGSRIFVSAYLKGLFDKEEERSALEPFIEKLITDFEATAKAGGFAEDASAAMAFSVSVLYSIASGSQLDEEAFPILIDRFRAYFNSDTAKKATDRQKQEVFEWAICSSSLVLAMSSAADTDEGKQKIQILAKAQIQALTGAKLEQITLKGKVVEVTAAPQVTVDSGPTPPKTTGGIAPGFGFQMPSGWTKNGVWNVWAKNDSGSISSAMIRFPAAIPASGNMGDALRKLWKENIPSEMANSAGGMVYRRYLGKKLFSQFIFGKGREKQRRADTLFTLFLVDCGSTWQPVVLAQTYEDTDQFNAGEEFSAQFSYPTTAAMAEQLFATLSCSGAPNSVLADKSSIVGNYKFGSGANMQYEHIYTGATTFAYVSYGGELNLAADGSFTYTYSSATGVGGAASFRGAKGSGSWSISGDLLTCTFAKYDQGDSYFKKSAVYRIAGLTKFQDGSKVIILISELDKPVNSITVADSSQWFSTKK